MNTGSAIFKVGKIADLKLTCFHTQGKTSSGFFDLYARTASILLDDEESEKIWFGQETCKGKSKRRAITHQCQFLNKFGVSKERCLYGIS